MADKSNKNKNNTNKMLDDLSRRLGVPQDKIKISKLILLSDFWD